MSAFNLWVDIGALYPLYVAYYFITVLLSHIFLYKGFKENEGFKKRQIKIIFIATLIGFGGGMTNFLPQLFGIYPFGNFIIFLYPILITYGVFLRRD
jgi:predicted proteasome-type protease